MGCAILIRIREVRDPVEAWPAGGVGMLMVRDGICSCVVVWICVCMSLGWDGRGCL